MDVQLPGFEAVATPVNGVGLSRANINFKLRVGTG